MEQSRLRLHCVLRPAQIFRVKLKFIRLCTLLKHDLLYGSNATNLRRATYDIFSHSTKGFVLKCFSCSKLFILYKVVLTSLY